MDLDKAKFKIEAAWSFIARLGHTVDMLMIPSLKDAQEATTIEQFLIFRNELEGFCQYIIKNSNDYLEILNELNELKEEKE